MGLDSSGGRFRGAAADEDARYLLAARATLMRTMDKTKEMALSIDKSHMRLQGMIDSLPALEAAIKPLQAQTLLQKGLGAKIDKASEPAERVLQTFEIIRGLERILKGDPRLDLAEYLASLSQLEEAMMYLSENCLRAVKWISDAVSYIANSKTADNYRMYQLNEKLASVLQDMNSEEGRNYDMGLLEIALVKLDTEFKRLLLENSGPMTLPDAVPPVEESVSADGNEEPETVSLPPILPIAVSEQLQTIVERTLFHKWTDNLLEIYRESRLVAIRASLQGLDADYLGYSTAGKIDKLPWEELEGMIASWTQDIEVACRILFKSERRLCTRVFSKVEKEKWIRCWGKLVTGGFLPFLEFGEGVALSEIAPAKLFKLLDMYEAMEHLLPSIFEVFEGPDVGCGEIRIRARELQKKIVTRASETLTEFGRSVEDGPGDAPLNGERSRLCSYVVNYVKYLVSDFYGPIMSKVLRVYQRAEAEAAGAGAGGAEESDEKWLSVGIVRMMQSLEKHLQKQAKTYDDPTLGHIFMMNNLWYMLTRAKDSELSPLLGESWVKDCRGKVRQHTLNYQRETWGKMLDLLKRDGLSVSSGGRGTTRELVRSRLKQFTACFDETCLKHSRWVIPDEELREGVELAVTQAVVPAYRSYTTAYKGFLDQGVSTKYMKYSAEEVETMVDDLFQVRAQDRQSRNGTTGHEV